MVWFKCLRKGRKISLLVPYRDDGSRRSATWNWLSKYWEHELPGANIVIGHNGHVPFCKTMAVNDAFIHSKGDVVVILDADCYIPGAVILEAAKSIRQARRKGRKLWFVPYRHFYRLTNAASQRVLNSNPEDPYHFSTPPAPHDTEANALRSSFGHWWGALIQVMPREAFALVGGMDPRFEGWGGEDVSFMHTLDTLYAHHKTVNSDVLHLWHPVTVGRNWWERKWDGQVVTGQNDTLSWRYKDAVGDPYRMKRLIEEE